MADQLRIGLQKLLRKAMIDQDADFLKDKEGVRVLSQVLMEMEVEEYVGAARHECSAGRTGQRNGYRERSWDTRVGTVELKVPRVRDGGYFQYGLDKENNRFAKGFGRLKPDTMARVFDPKLGHLPFDHARIAAIASRGQGSRGYVGQ